MKQELINIYIEAYESGSHDLRTLNQLLKTFNIKFKASKGKIVKIIAA